MINVLHIINGADLGGISSMILNYYRYIDREKYHFDFIYSIDEPLGHNGTELEKLGAEFYYVPKKSESLKAHIEGIKEILNRKRYDAIHVHSSLTSYVALSVAKKCGVKVRIAHAHNAVKVTRGAKGSIKRFIGIALNNRYSTVRLGCSQDALNYVFGKSSEKDHNSIVLPNSIPAQDYAYSELIRNKLRLSYGINENELVFGTVGRMSQEKNIIYLVDILNKLINDIPCKLVLVGDGDERKKIEQRIDELGLRNCAILTGQSSNVKELLNMFDVFVIPSINEGFSIAGLEAGTNGLPIIMSDAVPDDLGFFPNTRYLSLDDPQKWAEAIKTIPKGRNKNAITDVKSKGYDIEDSARKLEQIYCGRG